jgi:hypothetical protein
MHRLPFAFLFTAAAVFGQQQAPAPADTLQALLAEVHQLRMDLQSTTVTAQRVQILLYRVQLQQTTVNRASTHADEVHGKLAGAQQSRERVGQDLQRIQEAINNPATDQNTVKQLQSRLVEMKKSVEMWQSEEQQWQAREIEAQSQLRNEQGKLSELQDTLDKLDKLLADLAKQ